jgi:NAD(P)-dependent dehydrogenase (short-subunit alcohol dehydrogenase family)
VSSPAELSPLVVITGAAGHIGLACARRFRDFRLLICDLGEEATQAAAAQLCAEGSRAVPFVADITKRADVLELARAAAREGGLQVLVHAAGVAPPTPPEVIYAVNLLGTIHVLDEFEPLLQPGVVGVCVASMAGHRTLGHQFDALLLDPTDSPATLAQRIESESPGTPKHRLAYAASKRGTILQVQRRARDWGRRGARLLSVSPGVLGDTAMGARRQSGLNHQGDDSPLGRLGTSAEVAEVIRFAASPAASFMTGTDLLVDGGYVASANHHFDLERRDRWHALEF